MQINPTPLLARRGVGQRCHRCTPHAGAQPKKVEANPKVATVKPYEYDAELLNHAPSAA